jgi:hypothetical protein
MGSWGVYGVRYNMTSNQHIILIRERVSPNAYGDKDRTIEKKKEIRI